MDDVLPWSKARTIFLLLDMLYVPDVMAQGTRDSHTLHGQHEDFCTPKHSGALTFERPKQPNPGIPKEALAASAQRRVLLQQANIRGPQWTFKSFEGKKKKETKKKRNSQASLNFLAT